MLNMYQREYTDLSAKCAYEDGKKIVMPESVKLWKETIVGLYIHVGKMDKRTMKDAKQFEQWRKELKVIFRAANNDVRAYRKQFDRDTTPYATGVKDRLDYEWNHAPRNFIEAREGLRRMATEIVVANLDRMFS